MVRVRAMGRVTSDFVTWGATDINKANLIDITLEDLRIRICSPDLSAVRLISG